MMLPGAGEAAELAAASEASRRPSHDSHRDGTGSTSVMWNASRVLIVHRNLARARARLRHEDAHRIRNALANLLDQVAVHDQHARSAVAQDVPDLGGLEVPVDQAVVRADRPRRQHQLEDDGLVVQHQGDDPTWAEPQRVQGDGRALATGAERLGRLGPAVEVNRRAHRFAPTLDGRGYCVTADPIRGRSPELTRWPRVPTPCNR
jgi:hypothetical protein